MRRLAYLVAAIVLALAAARCSRDVHLGVDPSFAGDGGGSADGGTDTDAD
jgi:hypothetical protein